jgi:ABC-type phosphate/phosphonate transport system substrate-binding protein
VTQYAPGEEIEVRVALYKQGGLGDTYFQHLRSALELAFDQGSFRLKFAQSAPEEQLYQQLRDGDVDVVGELTPAQYVLNHRRSKFRPLLGIEYNNTAFYRSVLVVPNEAPLGNNFFRKAPGCDNLQTIRLLIQGDAKILYLCSDKSTSGYYYPISYMLDHGISLEATRCYDEDYAIYEDVLAKKDNNLIAGWLADYRLDSYTRIKDVDERLKKCGDPIVVDRSDPIPHGVFVISDQFRKKLTQDQYQDLLGRWKTVTDAHVVLSSGEGPRISGWREGVESDLAIVEQHVTKVRYHQIWSQSHTRVLASLIVTCIILLSAVALFVLHRAESAQG